VSLYVVNITIHILAAFVWIGGMLFFAIVAAPVLRRIEPPEVRARLFEQLGEAFRIVGWTAIAVLLATGLVNLRLHGWLGPAARGEPQFWSSMAGQALALKFACVALMLLLSAIHDFWLGPAASKAEPGSTRRVTLRRAASWIGRTNAVLGILLVYVAVRLTRGL
jgi:copper resistance protein D